MGKISLVKTYIFKNKKKLLGKLLLLASETDSELDLGNEEEEENEKIKKSSNNYLNKKENIKRENNATSSPESEEEEEEGERESLPSKFIIKVETNDGPVGFSAAWLLDNMPKRRKTSLVVTRIEIMMRMMMIHVWSVTISMW